MVILEESNMKYLMETIINVNSTLAYLPKGEQKMLPHNIYNELPLN